MKAPLAYYLADNHVWAAMMDRQGMMWLGTPSGISRYDGYDFKNFSRFGLEGDTLAGAMIVDMLQDEAGYIWLASLGDGLIRFDPVTESFRQYMPPFPDSAGFEANEINCLYLDEQNRLWAGTYRAGLLMLDASRTQFKSFNLFEGNIMPGEAMRLNSVHAIAPEPDQPAVLWLAANNGLHRFNTETGTFRHIPSPAPNTSGMSCHALFFEKPGVLWVGTYGGGLARINTTDADTWTYFPPDPQAWNSRNAFTNIVFDIQPHTPHELWVSTEDQGLLLFHTQTHQYSMMPTGKQDDYALPEKGIRKVYLDPQQRLWVLSMNKGISFTRPGQDFFHFRPLSSKICSEESNHYVRDFAWDPGRERLFVASSGCEGLHVLDDQGGAGTGWLPKQEAGREQSFQAVLADSRGTVWLGGLHNIRHEAQVIERPALYRLPAGAAVFEIFRPPGGERIDLQNYDILDILEDRQGNLWFGTHGGGLIQWDAEKEQLRQYIQSSSQPGWVPADTRIIELLEDPGGQIWLATENRGLLRFQPEKEVFFPFVNEHASLSPPIRCMALDQEGMIWVGTKDRGILYIDPMQADVGIQGRLTQLEGLPSKRIVKIARDKEGDMWISTESGLCRFQHSSKNLLNFTTTDGLTDTYLMGLGLNALPNGKVYLGFHHGFYDIDPAQLYRQEEPPALVFTGFRVFEQEKHFEKHISFMDKVVLAYADNFFSIEFALLDYRPGQKRNYAYQLEGYDADWVYPADGRRVASYTDVREGSYTFRVKALDPYNPQQERSKAIELEVLPPWYRSPWAYSLYALAALMTAFLSRREILRRERLKNQHKLEALELQKMKELDELRLRFFANISHEFRTPLTVIQGMADEIQSNFAKLDSWHISERLEAIHRNSKQLLRLVNQILDLSKLEANAMKLQPVQDDFVAFLRYLTQPFATYAASRSIRFIFQSTDKNLVADFDPHKLADIVSNLLSNALKFTPAGGEINLQIAKGKQAIAQFTGRATEELDNKLLIRISDTGIGISPDKLPHIFDRFYQVDDSSTRAGEGTGIGLALTRELVLLMGGEIEVMSETGKGTTFHILLPHTRQARTGNATQLAFSEHISGIQSPTEAPSSTPSATKGELPLILLVEDHADVRQYLKAALKGPYRLLAAANGAEGIRKALHHIPDLIISDVMMPEKDGLELTNTLKQDEKTSHVPIILLTARAAVEDRLAGLKRGADAYITKPFLREELLLRVNNLLEVRKQLRKRYAALSPLAPPPDEATQIEDFFLLKVNKFIEQKIDDPGLDVPALAGEMNMSRSQLHRKLKALTDRSASAYIRAFRLQRARQQLEKGNVRVAEVAYSVGFQDPNYFSRAFSKEFGIRPSEITPN